MDRRVVIAIALSVAALLAWGLLQRRAAAPTPAPANAAGEPTVSPSGPAVLIADTRPAPNGDPAPSNAISAASSGELEAPRLLGTLQINADVPFGRTPFTGHLPDRGWMFLNGNLISRLPVTKRLLLMPGEYEVRAFLANVSESGVKLWTVRWSTSVETAKTRELNASADLVTWAGTGYTGALRVTRLHKELKDYQAPFRGGRYGTFTVDRNVAENLEREAKTLDERLKAFVGSAAWKPIQELAETLAAAPPPRDRTWARLPEDLGGAREVDPSQLEVLAELYKDRVRDALGDWDTKRTADDGSNALTPEGHAVVREQVQRFAEFVKDRVKWVGDVFEEMSAPMRKAAR